MLAWTKPDVSCCRACSFMSGRRPEQTKAWNFIDDFRTGANDGRKGAAVATAVGGNWSTMPGFFLAHGYQVYGAGKTFHPGRPPNNDGERSWTSYSQGAQFHNASCGKVVMKQIVSPRPQRRPVACDF